MWGQARESTAGFLRGAWARIMHTHARKQDSDRRTRTRCSMQQRRRFVPSRPWLGAHDDILHSSGPETGANRINAARLLGMYSAVRKQSHAVGMRWRCMTDADARRNKRNACVTQRIWWLRSEIRARDVVGGGFGQEIGVTAAPLARALFCTRIGPGQIKPDRPCGHVTEPF
jgi:hypothetical protein